MRRVGCGAFGGGTYAQERMRTKGAQGRTAGGAAMRKRRGSLSEDRRGAKGAEMNPVNVGVGKPCVRCGARRHDSERRTQACRALLPRMPAATQQGRAAVNHHPKPQDLTPRLITWFHRARRDLPWRRTRDPYRIWVAEIMLQQTQVGRVIPFYHRFVAAFPTAHALAAAHVDDVLRHWAGLGYYPRARNLHLASRLVVERHGGRFPECYRDAVALPGVGEYTAGAILSTAFGHTLPAIDANASRVLYRVFLDPGCSSAALRQRILALGRQAVPERDPGEHNQALMELGALICLPRAPLCPECCLADLCRARRIGEPGALPTTRRSQTQRRRAALAVVQRRGRVLVAQRAAGGLWGGLWEFPNIMLGRVEGKRKGIKSLLRRDFGLEVDIRGLVTTLTYSVMNQRVELFAYRCTCRKGRTIPRTHVRARWLTPHELASNAFPSPHRKVARILATEIR